MTNYEVTIQGVPPGLLMHKFGIEAQVEGEKVTQKAVKVQGTREEQAEAVAYHDDDGALVQPAEHVYQSLVKAATDFRVKGKGKKTYKDAIKGNVIIEPEYIPHGQDGYKIDSRPVRIGRARILRHRPWLPEWELSFRIRVIDPDEVPGEVLQAVIVNAGQKVGIGDYRPRFGRFIVTAFKAC